MHYYRGYTGTVKTIYKTNDKYSASNYNASDVSECNAVSKTFYRTMVEYN